MYRWMIYQQSSWSFHDIIMVDGPFWSRSTYVPTLSKARCRRNQSELTWLAAATPLNVFEFYAFYIQRPFARDRIRIKRYRRRGVINRVIASRGEDLRPSRDAGVGDCSCVKRRMGDQTALLITDNLIRFQPIHPVVSQSRSSLWRTLIPRDLCASVRGSSMHVSVSPCEIQSRELVLTPIDSVQGRTNVHFTNVSPLYSSRCFLYFLSFLVSVVIEQ